MATTLSVALDWTPNTNHTAFYVAKRSGLYQQEGLDVQLISPHVDGYQVTPAAKVADKTATFAVVPSETIISYQTQPGKPKLQAVAAILSTDTSVIATLASSGIDRPSKLDCKVYASYGARYEGRIVQQMIRNDGGRGAFQEVTPPKLGIWDTLLTGEADATWIFEAWEGVEAQQRGVKLNTFRLGEYQVPYGYSPVLVVHPDSLRSQPDMVRAFLRATDKAVNMAVAQPEQAAQDLVEQATQENASLPVPLDLAMVTASQRLLKDYYLDPAGKWGRMDKARWDTFLDWLAEQGLLTSAVQSRTPQPGNSDQVTLDDLRAGKAGTPIARSDISSQQVFTNDYLL